MFVATVINFLLYSLDTGTQVAGFIVFVRKTLILDIDYPLAEKRESVDNALLNMNIVHNWAAYLPVSIKLSLSDPGSIHARRSRYWSAISSSFGELGPSFQIDSGWSSYRLFCGLEPRVNGHFPGRCSFLLNLSTPRGHPRRHDMDIDP